MSRKRRERAEDVLELEEEEELREDEEDAEVQRRLESRRRDQSARMGYAQHHVMIASKPTQKAAAEAGHRTLLDFRPRRSRAQRAVRQLHPHGDARAARSFRALEALQVPACCYPATAD